MLDIISFVTNTKDDFAKLPPGARAVQIADGATSTYFLTTFGRAKRETACSCEVKMEPTLSQALHLMNGDTVNNKIRQGGLIKQYKDQGLEPMQIVERLYITCLSRKPTEEEKASLAPLFAEGSNVDQGLEDVFLGPAQQPRIPVQSLGHPHGNCGAAVPPQCPFPPPSSG